MRWHHLILILAPSISCGVDASLTLYGQSDKYWSGDRSDVRELSPEPRRLLAISPWLFTGVVVGWIAAIGFMLVVSTRFWATAIASTVAIAHVSGAASWLMWATPSGYQQAIALKILCGIALAVSVNCLYKLPDKTSPFVIFPGSVYRIALVLLLVAITYMFLIPH